MIFFCFLNFEAFPPNLSHLIVTTVCKADIVIAMLQVLLLQKKLKFKEMVYWNFKEVAQLRLIVLLIKEVSKIMYKHHRNSG